MKTILVVDDLQENRYLLEMTFRGLDYRTLTAENGAVALDLARSERPDLVISDVLMPVMDGFELCRRMKTDPQLRAIPFLVYTATYTEPEDERFALGLGADRFITKPQDPAYLVAVVRQMLNEGSPRLTRQIQVSFETELTFLRQHNETLYQKLQKKMRDLRENQQRILEERASLRTLIRTIPDLVWLKDLDGVYQFCNPRFEAFFGQSEDAICGKTDEDFVARDQADWFRDHDRAAMAAGRPSVNEEWVTFAADGHRELLETIKTPMRDSAGRIVGVLGIARDVTQSRQDQERLQRLTEDQKASEEKILRLNADLEHRVAERTRELEAANRELEAFAHSVSHDLRAPIRHLDGFLELLGEHLGEHLDAQGGHLLDMAKQAAVRMGQQVDALLSFSRLGRAELHVLDLDLGQVLASVIEAFRPEWADRRVRWQVGPLPAIQGDPTLVHLVFQNLLANALKFTRGRAEPLIQIQALEGLAGETGFLVRDNGAGFDPAYGHRLFGVFQRLHREAEFEGTGIGLANVQRIVSRHGGRVWAEGRPNQGATFFVAFPDRSVAP